MIRPPTLLFLIDIWLSLLRCNWTWTYGRPTRIWYICLHCFLHIFIGFLNLIKMWSWYTLSTSTSIFNLWNVETGIIISYPWLIHVHQIISALLHWSLQIAKSDIGAYVTLVSWKLKLDINANKIKTMLVILLVTGICFPLFTRT